MIYVNCSSPRCIGRSRHSPAPLRNCTLATVFSDCFTGCIGTPPICGWTQLSTGVGTVSFDGDKMIMGSIGGPDTSGNAWKLTPGPMPPAGFTVQYQFTECMAPTAGQTYQVAISDGFSSVKCFISMVAGPGPGGVVQVTLGGGSARWDGTWTPSGISTPPHTVHLSVDGAVIPTLYLDTVAIPLTLFGPVAPPPAQPPSSVRARVLNTISTAKGTFDWIVATHGMYPPTTVFCCPEGGPTT